MSVLQKIKDIEDEMAKTQKNKATAGHLGMLKVSSNSGRLSFVHDTSDIHSSPVM